MSSNQDRDDGPSNPLTILHHIQTETDQLAYMLDGLLEPSSAADNIQTDLLRVQGTLAKVQHILARRLLKERRNFQPHDAAHVA